MMSTENPKQASAKSASRKSSSAGPAKYQEPSVRCPRCDSPNTKFCYYNNYSLSQPRHFCKTCRRYWTKGGALRNVPIGGGCRKNKKLKCSPRDSSGGGEATDVGGLRFFQGISPAMDFQLNFSRLNSPPHPNHAIFGHFSALGDNNIQNIANPSSISTPGFTFDPTIGFPFSSSGFKQVEPNNVHEMETVNFQRNFASSIESLSSINQDLHWKLQQQRLAMFVSQDNEKESSNFSLPSIDPAVPVIQKPQPILFQNLEVSNSKEESCTRKDGGTSGSLSTEWFFDTSLATSSRNANENINNWGGIQAWTDFP